jgi:cytochrome c oxidase assembly protein subunit 15
MSQGLTVRQAETELARRTRWRPTGWRPGPRVVRGSCLAVLVMNVVIVVTGEAVRLTGSGLGCPTWPECSKSGSLVPTQALGYWAIIEFSNRMLTFVLCVVIGAAILATMFARPRRPVLVRLAWAQFAGAVAQAVIGGISVRTDLAPVWVAVHLLVSMVMIAGALVLWTRSAEPDAPARPVVRRELRVAGRLLVAATAALLVAGTVVTGSGPHSGSVDAKARFPLSPQTATQFHADLVFLVVGLTVALWFGLRATAAPDRVLAAVRGMFVVLVLQAAIGYTQYFTGLPAWLVVLHGLGACLTWLAALRVLLGMRTRVRATIGAEAPADLSASR